MQTLDITIEETAGVARRAWPVMHGVPFPEGGLESGENVRLVADDDEEVPCVAKVTCRHPDGSVQWLLLEYQADLAPQETKTYRLDYGDDVSREDPEEGIKISEEEGDLTVSTGAAEFILSQDGPLPFVQVTINDKDVLAEESHAGCYLQTENGATYQAAVNKERGFVVEEHNPLRAVLKCSGKHSAEADGKVIDFELRYIFFAGKSHAEVYYSVINKEPAPQVVIAQLSMSFMLNLGEEDRMGLVGADIIYPGRGSVSVRLDKRFALRQEMPPLTPGALGGTVFRTYDDQGKPTHVPGFRSALRGWIDCSDGRVGLTTHIYDFRQQFPKQIYSDGRLLRLDLFPLPRPEDAAGDRFPQWLQHRDRDFRRIAGRPLVLHQGMAKTHRILCYFHEGSGEDAKAVEVAKAFDTPLLPVINSNWYARSGAFGDIMSFKPEKYPFMEQTLRDMFFGFKRAFGILDYGDCESYLSEGGQWNNGEYDMTRAALLQFARTGERQYFTWAYASAIHLLDVDHIHYHEDPMKLGGVFAHSYPDHAGPAVSVSHMWTEGLFDFYFLTGHRSAFKTALAITDNIMRRVERDKSRGVGGSVRNFGWPLVALTSAYKATGQERFLDACKKLVEDLSHWQGEDGEWKEPLGEPDGIHDRRGTPFMTGIGLAGLKRYILLTNDENAKDVFVKAARWLIERGTLPQGIFYYRRQEHHEWSHTIPLTGCLIGEGLAFAYDLTHDRKFLEVGLRNLRYDMMYARQSSIHSTNSPYGEPKVDGKFYAQALRGVFNLMRAADEAGILEDI
ncbi:MAG: hypothetical protein GXP25_25185 [Planctomycetes bacterium]|nr:hypothetical protein [Planctomycetota bacterium]